MDNHRNHVLINESLVAEVSPRGIARMQKVGDPLKTTYIMAGEHYGSISISCTQRETKIGFSTASAPVEKVDYSRVLPDSSIFSVQYATDPLLVMICYELTGNCLEQKVSLKNTSAELLVITDLSTYYPSNTYFSWDETPAGRTLNHCFIGGHGSFVYTTRCDGEPPYLLVIPSGQTKFEFFDSYSPLPVDPGDDYIQSNFQRAYVHATEACALATEMGTTWRYPTSSLQLTPGEEAEIGFYYMFVDSDQEIRENLVSYGSLDVVSLPGFTVPLAEEVLLSIRCSSDVRVEGARPGGAIVTPVQKLAGRNDFRIVFCELGEQQILVHYADGMKWAVISYFVTEAISVLLHKRSAFICDKQYRGDRWYNGLFCEWNNKTGVMLTPDNYDGISGWRIYAVSCDDPGLAKPAFLSEKLAVHPIQNEVEALDYYIGHFLWGGMQFTDDDEYPYGILGTPDWYANRNSDDFGLGRTSIPGRLHIWRIYDYPHIALLYYNMYRIARDYPGITTVLSGEEYLKRAYRTALAMFSYPAEVDSWPAYSTGLYNELCLPEIIAELRRNGRQEWAQRLSFHWDRKVQSFALGKADLFSSEYPFDTTGYEAAHALAKDALRQGTPLTGGSGHPRRPDINLEQAWILMQNSLKGNLACRGRIEPSYFWYGSDYRRSNFRYTLSYMAQMGGWALLDYALYYAADPFALLRLAYGSVISSWALINSGTDHSNYGYFFPGAEHDGAACGGFEPAPYGKTWLEQPHNSEPWYYSCEIDLGFCAGVRAAATVIAEDPDLGLIAYGATMEKHDDYLCIDPRDGVRRRFHYIAKEKRFHLTLQQSCFAMGKSLELSTDLKEMHFSIDCSLSAGVEVRLTCSQSGIFGLFIYIDGLQQGEVNGCIDSEFVFTASKETHLIECKTVSGR